MRALPPPIASGHLVPCVCDIRHAPAFSVGCCRGAFECDVALHGLDAALPGAGDVAPHHDFREADEKLLATRFGVSRTPVREALMQLDAIGLIEIRPRRGAVVVDPGPHRICEMFEVVAEMEGLAGSLAARRLDEAAREAISSTHDRCQHSATTGDSDAYYSDNEAFHKAIYAASRSDFLEEQCTQLHRRLRPYRRLQLRVRNRLPTSFKEHSAIVEAIFAGEAEEARRLLRAHVGIQGERFSDLVADMATR